MTSAPQILTEIAQTRDDTKRRDLLRKACDLFEVASASLSEEETALFDEVLGMLSERVDEVMRAEVSERISKSDIPLENTTNAFAFDRKIEVAGPILKNSKHLSDETLVSVAKIRGQKHMAAIAVRPQLNPTVTDTLVELGDKEVLHNVAANAGAQFSEPGMSKLTDRAKDDADLQQKISDRQDLSPQAIEKLVSVATDEIREKLKGKSENAALLAEKARAALEAKLGIDRIDFIAADRKVRRLVRDRKADEGLVKAFADQKAFGELIAALGIVMSLNLEQSKQLMIEQNALMIAVKAHAFAPSTLRAILRVGPVYAELSDVAREELILEFEKQDPETAQRVMRFWRARSKLSAA